MKFVAITSCPTGIAHTYMAAEALQVAAREMGHDIKVETQGSVGVENVLTPEDLAQAKAVIIAADTSVDKSRFAGMTVIEVSTKDAIKDALGLLTRAVNAKGSSKSPADQVTQGKPEGKETKTGVYKHLMTGVSYMIPFVVAGGLLIALGFAFGGIYVYEVPGSFGETLFSAGKAAFALMVPVLGAYIAFSIADRPGIVPGMIGGLIAANNGSGFLGAMVAGFAAGYTVLAIKKFIKLPKSLQGLMPILIIPVLSTAIMGLLMVYVIGKPMTSFNTGLAAWLTSLSGTNAALLGIILGAMMAFDMGGPVNKAAYTFGAASVASGNPSAIMAAVMISGMVPPLAIALSTVMTKTKYTLEEREAGKANWALGLSFITEGAIPFAAADPLRVMPSIMIGSAVAGGISMAFGSTIIVPHGGIWVLAIPHVVTNLVPYILALVAGTIVSASVLSVVKKPVSE
ncbi:PTS fructose transporter subunit IIBC [Desulfosporosinus fructosivorans]|uniref:PTS fructose transporter subunit IIBC n=1 Tax=Desulfosporosinus fructosivorans TaxID=2018669 RepID=A0A4Z0QWF2_9FIRM|nr:fructose-specific PTS transporter subunit EIIC [Desulfosporosinus fructosivorans]TGE34838.1 PTS fructose transporter subunit IIBC [Desulfosporosinus fructosivorans]